MLFPCSLQYMFFSVRNVIIVGPLPKLTSLDQGEKLTFERLGKRGESPKSLFSLAFFLMSQLDFKVSNLLYKSSE